MLDFAWSVEIELTDADCRRGVGPGTRDGDPLVIADTE